MDASGIRVDGRSGKPVSLDLKHPILPGDGVGNALLWSVGGGHGSPGTAKEWGDIGVQAVKVRAFEVYSILLIIDAYLMPY